MRTIDWFDPSYLRDGTAVQRNAYRAIERYAILQKLMPFDPVIVGTIPIGIDIDGSDLDVACETNDFAVFEQTARAAFGELPQFELVHKHSGPEGRQRTVVRFHCDGLPVELYAESKPVRRQNGYIHMVVEARLLELFGEAARSGVVRRKRNGLKTEPAFAQVFRLEGDPYEALLRLESASDEQLLELQPQLSTEWENDMNITTILFDFDGTLADTLPICIHSIAEAFRTYDGRALTGPDVVAMFGPTEADIIRLNLTNREAAEEAVRLFYSCYETEHARMVRPNAEMTALLGELKRRGYRMGIVTGKGRDSLNISLERLALSDYFDVTVSGDDMTRPKPDPEGVETAMKELGASRGETVFIGDSEADMRAGKGAGVFTIGAHWLENVQSLHFDTKPDLTVTSTGDLIAFLNENGAK